jgi:hypothetical protein
VAERIPTRLSRGEARRFGLVVGSAFVLFGTLLWWGDRPSAGLLLGGLGAALMVYGVMLPRALSPVHRAWMALALALSKITTPIFLGCVYFGIITPIGFVRRLFGHDAVRPKPTSGTLWVPRNSRPGQPDMKHQF